MVSVSGFGTKVPASIPGGGGGGGTYYILNASKTQLLQYSLTRLLFYYSNKMKSILYKSMVAIHVHVSSQYSFGADKAVQIRQAIVFDKWTQPELRHKNC